MALRYSFRISGSKMVVDRFAIESNYFIYKGKILIDQEIETSYIAEGNSLFDCLKQLIKYSVLHGKISVEEANMLLRTENKIAQDIEQLVKIGKVSVKNGRHYFRVDKTQKSKS